jgi:hypothetical protein
MEGEQGKERIKCKGGQKRVKRQVKLEERRG